VGLAFRNLACRRRSPARFGRTRRIMTMRRALYVMLLASFVVGMPTDAAGQEKGLLYAHRGGAYEFEENTMEAFRGSYEHGLRGFETDVRMSKDGELIILHDDSLDRTHTATGPAEHR